MGSGARAHGSQPWSRESLEGSLPAHYEAQGQCPLHLPAIGESRLRGQKEVGHQGLKTPQWSAVRRTGFAQPVRASQEHAVATYAPLRRSAPSSGAKTRSALLWGANRKQNKNSRGIFPAARTKRRVTLRTGLFDNLDLERARGTGANLSLSHRERVARAER